ncbi:hypothetical protein [Croceivirga sp. JEA036]|uniref:hypothetical protein n=1 Tax=Croceivirga sp. JEA036 TaxID=2721162 RepID=UPI001438A60C|nr:hypothetical protein [Croceivirga sp. JEA036]NJB37112.1 hypothetical protein [Croceivirga sp. JEA036]
MKSLTYIATILLFSLTGCKSQQDLVTNPPFTTGTVTCQSWVGGRAESGSGIKLVIPVEVSDKSKVDFKKAYFREKSADLKWQKVNGVASVVANFVTISAPKPDIIMHADPKKEVGNTPPLPKEKLPFELEENECVLSYLENGKLKYVKLEGIKEQKKKLYQ